MKKLLTGLVVVVLLAGCGVSTQSGEQPKEKETTVAEQKQAEEQAQIVITKEHGTEKVADSTLDFQEGQSLMDVMKENFEIETAYEGAFITGVNGEIADESKQYAWMFSINGVEAMVGANDYLLKDGDIIEFDLHKW